MFFQNARDAIKVIKETFADRTYPTAVESFTEDVENLIKKYAALNADFERVSQGWRELNNRYETLNTRFGSLYEFMCEDCIAKWNYIVDREEEDAEQCGSAGATSD